MTAHDPRTDPKTAPIWSNEVNQPYARRSISAFVGVLVAVFVIGGLAMWYFLPSSPTVIEDENATVIVGSAPQEAATSGRGTIYNFFYKMFGGIEDGLDNTQTAANDIAAGGNVGTMLALQNEVRSQAFESVDDGYRHSIYDIIGSDVIGRQGEEAGLVHDIVIEKETGMARAVIVDPQGGYYNHDLARLRFDNVLKQQPAGKVRATITDDKIETKRPFLYDDVNDARFVSLRHLRDGQVLDDQGNVAGQVDAIIYQNAQAQRIFFALKPSLTSAGMPQIFGIPYEAVDVVQSADGFDIQLSKEQTQSLAHSLYGEGNTK